MVLSHPSITCFGMVQVSCSFLVRISALLITSPSPISRACARLGATGSGERCLGSAQFVNEPAEHSGSHRGSRARISRARILGPARWLWHCDHGSNLAGWLLGKAHSALNEEGVFLVSGPLNSTPNPVVTCMAGFAGSVITCMAGFGCSLRFLVSSNPGLQEHTVI